MVKDHPLLSLENHREVHFEFTRLSNILLLTVLINVAVFFFLVFSLDNLNSPKWCH